MKIHITNTYNVPKAAGQSQQKTTKIAREMGFLELDLFQFCLQEKQEQKHLLGSSFRQIQHPHSGSAVKYGGQDQLPA